MVVKPEIFTWQKTGSFYVALTKAKIHLTLGSLIVILYQKDKGKVMGTKCPKCHSVNPEIATFCADCGTKIFLPKDVDVTDILKTSKEELATGSTFAGKYKIMEELGREIKNKIIKVTRA